MMGSMMSLLIGGPSTENKAQLAQRPLVSRKRRRHVHLRQVAEGGQMELDGEQSSSASSPPQTGHRSDLLGVGDGEPTAGCTARAGYAAVVALGGRRALYECNALASGADHDESVLMAGAVRRRQRRRLQAIADSESRSTNLQPPPPPMPPVDPRSHFQQLGRIQPIEQEQQTRRFSSEQSFAHCSQKPQAQPEEHEQKNKEEEGEPSVCEQQQAAPIATPALAATTTTTMKTKTKPTDRLPKSAKDPALLQQRLAVTQANCMPLTTTASGGRNSSVGANSQQDTMKAQLEKPHGLHAAHYTLRPLNGGQLIIKQAPVQKRHKSTELTPLPGKRQQQQQQEIRCEPQNQLNNPRKANKLRSASMRCPTQPADLGAQQQQSAGQSIRASRKALKKERNWLRNLQPPASTINPPPSYVIREPATGAPSANTRRISQSQSSGLVVPARLGNNLRPNKSDNLQARNNYQQQKQQQKQRRNQRSLSTSSSLASSASSSPSSSMMQIYSHGDIRNGLHQRQNHCSTDHGTRMIQATLSSSPSSTSSASSTISTCSEVDEAIAVSSLLHSTANLSIHRSGQKPNYIDESHYRHHQTANLFRAPPINPYWTPVAYGKQEPDTHLDNNNQQHHLDLASYPAPPPRPWLHKQQQVPTMVEKYQQLEAPEFSVISYNVLCDRMVSNKMFPASPDIALNWFYRRELILRELLDYNADIIALQELEMEQYETYFKPQLEQFGHYDSIFEPKSRARTMDYHKRRRVDGCAIFFKLDRFKLIQRHLLEFNQIAMANAQGSEAMLNRVMTKDNIGLAAVLEFIEPQQVDDDDEPSSIVAQNDEESHKQRPVNPATMSNQMRQSSGGGGLRRRQQQQKRHILVCNTHIHWDPEYCDVKLIQTIMLMNELKCIAKQFSLQERLLSGMAGDCLDGHRKLSHRVSTNTNPVTLNGVTTNEQNFNYQNFNINDTVYIDGKQDENNDLLPLVLLGDFNSMPTSGVTSYLTGGEITSLHKDFKNFKYTSCSNALSTIGIQKANSTLLADGSRTREATSAKSGDTTTTTTTTTSTNHLINLNLRRQSSPARCFYSPSSSPSSLGSTLSASTSLSSTASSSTDGCHEAAAPGNCEKSVLNYNHPFELTSAYGKDTMPYTNYTTSFRAIIDYIFYSHSSLELLGLLGPLDKNWLKGNRIRGFPQPNLPSDHLLLLARFRLSGSQPAPEHPAPTCGQPSADRKATASPLLPVEQWPSAAEWDDLAASNELQRRPITAGESANHTRIKLELDRP